MTHETEMELEEVDALWQQHEEAELSIFPTVEDRRLFLTTLKLMGIAYVEVSFQGGGDSGEIDHVGATDVNGKPIDIEVEYPHAWQSQSNFVDGQWVDTLVRSPRKFSEMLESLTYSALEKSGHDWYNNDGGQGNMTIDFRTSPPEINLEVGVNYTSTDEHSYTL